MNDKKITIIIPVYNVEKYLRKCVDSVLAQTYTNLEVILIDDGSPDNCPAICDEYAAQDARVRVIHQKNAGVSAARNAGLDAATGDYIGFVDSDDWIEPDMYETLYELAEQTGTQISVVNFCRDTDESVGVPEKQDSIEILDGLSTMKEVLTYGRVNNKVFCGLTTYLIRHDQFDGIRFPEYIANGEDRIVGIKLFFNAESVSVRMYKCYHYYCREDSVTQTLSSKKLDAMDSDRIIDTWVSQFAPELRTITATNGIRMCIAFANAYVSGNQFTKEVYARIKECAVYYLQSKEKLLINQKERLGAIVLCLGRIPYVLSRRIWERLNKNYSTKRDIA